MAKEQKNGQITVTDMNGEPIRTEDANGNPIQDGFIVDNNKNTDNDIKPLPEGYVVTENSALNEKGKLRYGNTLQNLTAIEARIHTALELSPELAADLVDTGFLSTIQILREKYRTTARPTKKVRTEEDKAKLKAKLVRQLAALG